MYVYVESFFALSVFIVSIWAISYFRKHLQYYLTSKQIEVTFYDSTEFINGRNINNLVNTVGDVITVLIQFVGWDNFIMSSKELLYNANNINVGIFSKAGVDSDSDPVEVEVTKSVVKHGDYTKLKVEFCVRKSGIYNFSVNYKSFGVRNSPFTLTFHCGSLDPLQSLLICQSPTLLCYKTYAKLRIEFSKHFPHVSNIFVIEPLDQYGNTSNKAELQNLSFVIQEIKKIEKVIQLSVSKLEKYHDYHAEFQTNPRNNDTKLIIKVDFHKAGIFRGEISYDNVLIHNGLLNIIVIDIKEQQLILRVLERGLPLPQLEAHLHCSGTTFIAVKISMDTENVRINDINRVTSQWTKTIATFATRSLRIEITIFDEVTERCQLKLFGTPEARSWRLLAMTPVSGKLFVVLISNIQSGMANGNSIHQSTKRFEISTLNAFWCESVPGS